MDNDVEVTEGQALRAGSDWFQWYHVREHPRRDTIPEIAEWWYGRPAERWWRRIWLANRRAVGEDPNDIRPNQWLKLPYRGFSYHVERGDTLSQLAQWVYEDSNRWRQIHDANPWIRDPDELKRGWWIWIE
jgi:nucleoid-associated protein YgaU